MGKAGCLAVRPAHGTPAQGGKGDYVEQPSNAIAALATQTFTATHWQTTAYMMMIVEQRSSRSLWRSLVLSGPWAEDADAGAGGGKPPIISPSRLGSSGASAVPAVRSDGRSRLDSGRVSTIVPAARPRRPHGPMAACGWSSSLYALLQAHCGRAYTGRSCAAAGAEHCTAGYKRQMAMESLGACSANTPVAVPPPRTACTPPPVPPLHR